MVDALDSLDPASFAPWTPVFARANGVRTTVEWAIVDGPFRDPFFESTTARAVARPLNRCFPRTSSLETLRAVDAHDPGLEPSGFVFHMSRCGSTLAARMLGSLSDTIVLSEAQPIDAMLRLREADDRPDDSTLAALLRATIRVLGRPRAGERRSYVKFAAWHAFHLPFIASVYPDVPWVFLFREPRAVLHSQQRAAGAEFVLGTIDPLHAGLDFTTAARLPALDYGACLLGAVCDAAIAARHLGRSAFLDYTDLPGAVVDRVVPFFGVTLDATERSRLAKVATIDAKADGQSLFVPRLESSSPDLDLAARTWLDAPVRALRSLAEARR